MGVGWIALGAGAGALAVWLTAKEAVRRRRRFPRYEVWAWAGFLVVAALIYVGFAAFNGASAKWTWTELGGVAGYGLIAWMGAARFPQLVGVGWLLHVLWDVVLHPGGHPGFVPSWYPPLCLGFDVFVGVALVVRFRVTDDAAFWDGIAEKYAKQPVANPEAFDAKIAMTKSRMKATDVVLDIGCGTGSLALRLAGSAAQVHGLDISSEMIRIANGKARAHEVNNVTFHVGPFDETFRVFEAGSLDGICAYSLLHLVEDRSAALAADPPAAQAWRVFHFVYGLPRRVVGSLWGAHRGDAGGRESADGEDLRQGHARRRDATERVRGDFSAGRGGQGRHCVHRCEEAAVGKPP